MRPGKLLALLGTVALASGASAGCAADVAADQAAGLRVVATTPILADIAANVAGPDASVSSLIPPGKDPHTFEPTLRTIREVANADLSLANGFLLEPQPLLDTLRESGDAPVVEVADHASMRGAKLEPLVENVALDAVWLGLRVRGAPTDARSVDVALRGAEGPGEVAAYVVSTFGTPEVLFNTRDGVDEADSASLPPNAHTHVSWAFSAPGVYRLRFGATAAAETTVTVAVGVAPPAGMKPIDSGHIDITADLATGAIDLEDQDARFDPARTVLALPSSVLQAIPPDPAYRFLGRPGEETYLLPQAVLGKHIHGEVDPHLWHNIANAIAYAEVIAEKMAEADPSHGASYRARAEEYSGQLRGVDAQVRELIDSIPAGNRHLVTPHNGYGYLAQGYGIDVAGFVTPNPAIEPSPRDVIALRRTLENLHLPAVFIEPAQQTSAQTLEQTAADLGVKVCTIYGDSLDDSVPTYADLMLFNAHSLARCLGGEDAQTTQNSTQE